jgi:O-antigen/teichoic acid export membrane protein
VNGTADPSRLPVATGFVTRVLARARVPLYANALVLMGNTGLSAGLGFIFWALAARLYPPAQVGLASAAISAAVFIATFAQLGLPTALIRFSQDAGPDRMVLTSTVVLVVTVAGAAAAAVFVMGMGIWAPSLAELAPPSILAASVVTLAATTTASSILVFVAIGARDARPALAGGVTQGVVKGGLVLVFALFISRQGFPLVVAWILGTTAAILVQVWMLRAQLAPRVNLHLLRLGSFLRYSAGNYAGDLAWTAPSLLFPLLVLTQLGAEANAYFFVAWAIASLLIGIPFGVASSLLAEGSHEQGAMDEHFRRAVVLTLGLVVPAIAVFWLAAPLLLALFGASYAANGIDTLRALSLAALPMSINLLYLSVARLDRALVTILGISAATGGGSLVLGVIFAPAMGSVGIAIAYLVAHTVVAVMLVARWWLRGSSRRSGGRAIAR